MNRVDLVKHIGCELSILEEKADAIQTVRTSHFVKRRSNFESETKSIEPQVFSENRYHTCI